MNTVVEQPIAGAGGKPHSFGSRACRIAHLHSTLGIYGAERWTLALAKHLDPRKAQTTIISIGTKPGADMFYGMMLALGFRAFHLPFPGKLNPRAVLQLRRLLVDQEIDVVHTHGFKADILGYLATRRLPVRVVATVHGWSADEGLRIRGYETVGRWFLRRFDRVYALSPALLQDLLRRGFDPMRTRLILNAVDLSGIEYAFSHREQRDPFSLLFVGRLCRPKGIFDLVQAFALAKLGKSASLTLVGDGPDKAKIFDLAKSLGLGDRVNIVGAVPTVVPFLARANGLVLPSHSEGIPRCVMEAFAAGVPVIGTSIPGIQQLVQHEVTGLLVPVHAPEQLARAMERLYSAPEHAAHMSQAARLLVTTKFSSDRMAREYEEEYRQLRRES